MKKEDILVSDYATNAPKPESTQTTPPIAPQNGVLDVAREINEVERRIRSEPPIAQQHGFLDVASPDENIENERSAIERLEVWVDRSETSFSESINAAISSLEDLQTYSVKIHENIIQPDGHGLSWAMFQLGQSWGVCVRIRERLQHALEGYKRNSHYLLEEASKLLKESGEQYRSSILVLTQELHRMTHKISSASDESSNLLTQICQHQEQIRELQEECLRREEQREKLQTRNEGLVKKIEELDVRLQNFASRIRGYQSHIKDVESQNSAFNKELAEVKSALENERQVQTIAKARLLQDVEQLSRDKEIYQQKSAALLNLISMFHCGKFWVADKIEELEGILKYSFIGGDSECVRQFFTHAKAMNSEFNCTKSSLENERHSLNRVHGELAEVKSALEKSEEQVLSLREHTNTLEIMRDDLNKKLHEEHTARLNAEEQVEVMSSRYLSASSAWDSLQIQFEELKGEKATSEAMRTDAQIRFAVLELKNEDLARQLSNAEGRLDGMTNRYTCTQSALDSLREELAGEASTKNHYREKWEEAQREMERLNALIPFPSVSERLAESEALRLALMEQIEQDKKDAEEKEKKSIRALLQIQDELKRVQSERAKDRLELKQEAFRERDKWNGLQSQVEQLNSVLEAKDKENEALQRESANLRAKHEKLEQTLTGWLKDSAMFMIERERWRAKELEYQERELTSSNNFTTMELKHLERIAELERMICLYEGTVEGASANAENPTESESPTITESESPTATDAYPPFVPPDQIWPKRCVPPDKVSPMRMPPEPSPDPFYPESPPEPSPEPFYAVMTTTTKVETARKRFKNWLVAIMPTLAYSGMIMIGVIALFVVLSLVFASPNP